MPWGRVGGVGARRNNAPVVIQYWINKMNKPNLEELLKKWQAILRLQDWDVTIKYYRHYDMDEDVKGGVRMCVTKKTARISILDPDDFDPSIPLPLDVEGTVVHELVHLHLAILDDYEGIKVTLMEQVVDALSKALMDRERAAPPKNTYVPVAEMGKNRK